MFHVKRKAGDSALEMTQDEFSRYTATLGLSVDDPTFEAFKYYAELLRAWSQRVRLISHGDRDHIWSRHFLDSLTGVHALSEEGKLLDLGSGAGFPGLPLKLVVPGLRVTLVDSARMKCLFLKQVVSELHLDAVEVSHGRVEDIRDRSFDHVLARGIGSLNTLWALACPLLDHGSSLIAYKGPDEAIHLDDPGLVINRRVVRNPANGRERAIVSVRRSDDVPRETPV